MKASQTRRHALKNAAGGAVLVGAGVMGVLPAAAEQQEPPKQQPTPGKVDGGAAKAAGPPSDRDFVIAAGMTAQEADCWALAAKLAAAFFDLPELHPMDAQEMASAVHIIQNKLLSRPTYRRYLELARAGHELRKNAVQPAEDKRPGGLP